MTQTPNYKLTQWVKTDRIQMEDFNADNAKLDDALKAHDTAIAARATTAALNAEITARTNAVAAEEAARKQAIAAETAARNSAISTLNTAVARLGNCILYSGTYVGTGVLSAEEPKVLTFPKPPRLVYVAAPRTYHFIAAPGVTCYDGVTVYEYYNISWSGNSISWYGGRTVSEGLNASGATYYVVALLDAGT